MNESQRDKDLRLLINAQIRENSKDGVSWTSLGLLISLMVNIALCLANYHTYQALTRCLFGE